MESTNDDREKRETPDRTASPSNREPNNEERVQADDQRSRRSRDEGEISDDERVDEASRESFPASDPPAYP